ncbi:MAG: M24 family metallopeptidase [Candidatus Woesearchaeota archaeon]
MVDVFLKTEQNTSKSIVYKTGIATDLALYVDAKKPVLFITPLESPKTTIITKDFTKKDVVSKLKKYKEVGLVYGELTASELQFFKKNLKGVKLKDISEKISKERSVKTLKEIATIKKAVAITEDILQEMFDNFNIFKTEFDVAVFLKKACINRGVTWSFEPIVASGKHAKLPHYHPGKNTPLQKGFCIIDFGIVYNNYCSDMTRTIYVGTPSQKELDFYEKILSGLKKVEQEAKPGVVLKTPFTMIHALGHGVGLDVHESPNLHCDSLKENMVIALEPAQYDPFGVRIEDDYVITKKGAKRLGKLSRALKVYNKK